LNFWSNILFRVQIFAAHHRSLRSFCGFVNYQEGWDVRRLEGKFLCGGSRGAPAWGAIMLGLAFDGGCGTAPLGTKS
jgi:hypothetical protein